MFKDGETANHCPEKHCYLLTGSSSLHLLSQPVESLAGRIRIRECPTCAFGEEQFPKPISFLMDRASGLPFEASLAFLREGIFKLENAISYGGYPEVIETGEPAEQEEILKDYKNTYLTRDIIEISNIKDLNGFRALLAQVASSIGSTSDYSNFAKNAGLSFPTAKKYLFSLEQSYILFKVYPYIKSTAKRFIKSPKWYFTDTGFLHSFRHGLSRGAIMENFVIAELRKRLVILGRDPAEMYFSQSQSGAEVDLIVTLGNEKLAFEIKAGTTVGRNDYRNLKELMRIDRTISRGIVFYTGEEIREVASNITLLPITLLRGRL
jgi:predicted AAA+ superfamily ATPase